MSPNVDWNLSIPGTVVSVQANGKTETVTMGEGYSVKEKLIALLMLTVDLIERNGEDWYNGTCRDLFASLHQEVKAGKYDDLSAADWLDGLREELEGAE